jgi:hypothetical protein
MFDRGDSSLECLIEETAALNGVMILLLINQSNISRDFSLQLSKCLADSDLVVIGLTGIGPIRKISVLDWFLPYWPNESFYFDNCKEKSREILDWLINKSIIT